MTHRVTGRQRGSSPRHPRKTPPQPEKEPIMANHTTRKRTHEAKRETLRRREVRRAKYAGAGK